MKKRASWHPKYCKQCGKHESVVGRVSKRGQCANCQYLTNTTWGYEARNLTGEWYERWKSGVDNARAAGKHMGRPRGRKGGST